jgi:uncharacterized protein YndB with AHSA1/START domain
VFRIAPLLIACLLILPALSCASSGSQDKLQSLAAQGQIQDNAPVKASSEITIQAPPEAVWKILTGIDEWPQWQSTVPSAHLDGALQPGTTFAWKSGSAEIQSRLALVRRNEQIAWTGTAYKAHAIHIWSLQPLPNGGTLVKTKESMDGFMLTLFYSSKDLAKSQDVWLQALKHRAEK